MFKGWGGTSHTALGTEQCIHSIRPGPLGHGVFLLQHPGWRAGAGVVRFGCWVTWKSLWVLDSFGRAGYVSIDAKSSFLSPEHTSTMTKTVANRIKKRFKAYRRREKTSYGFIPRSISPTSPTFMSLLQTKWRIACLVCTCEWPLCGSAVQVFPASAC